MSSSSATLEIVTQTCPASPTLRVVSFEDYSGIAALYNRHGFGIKNFEEWASLWIHNPLYRELSHWPIGWLLEDENHTIVGYLGNIPLAYMFRGRPLVAATSRAWVVDSVFRSYSFLLLNQFFQQKSVDLFLNTTVNQNAIRGYQAFRVSRVPIGAWDQSMFWITNYRGFSSSLLASKGLPCWSLLTLPISLGLLTQDKLSRKTVEARRHGLTLTFVDSFDSRFDRFWERLLSTNTDLLLATRSCKILEWHFQRALAENRAWTLIAEVNSQLVAYAIFLRRDNNRVGLSRVRLIDFQSLAGGGDVLLSMLDRTLDRCRAEGIHMLEIIGLGSEKLPSLPTAGSRQRSLPSWMYFYKANGEALAQALKDPRSWSPSCFDGDASL